MFDWKSSYVTIDLQHLPWSLLDLIFLPCQVNHYFSRPRKSQRYSSVSSYHSLAQHWKVEQQNPKIMNHKQKISYISLICKLLLWLGWLLLIGSVYLTLNLDLIFIRRFLDLLRNLTFLLSCRRCRCLNSSKNWLLQSFCWLSVLWPWCCDPCSHFVLPIQVWYQTLQNHLIPLSTIHHEFDIFLNHSLNTTINIEKCLTLSAPLFVPS